MAGGRLATGVGGGLLTLDSLGMSVLVLILVVPLGAIALSYRAHRETALLRLDLERLEAELAYWRETGGRLMASIVRDQDPQRPAAKPLLDPGAVTAAADRLGVTPVSKDQPEVRSQTSPLD